MVASYRDERLKSVKPASVNREFAIYRHVLETAKKAWDVPLTSNPFADVTKPKVVGSRSRRLQLNEWNTLEQECRRSRNPHIRDMVEFGLETAMRRGEVLNARWRDVDFRRRVLHIPQTKNGHPRSIPLTTAALNILTQRNTEQVAVGDRIFPTTEDAVKMAWRRIMARARLPDFRYHDLRHEAVSRFFELGLTVPEVALISGHRDPRMLARYTHLRPENVAEKLARLTAQDTTISTGAQS
jgi:integrase